MRSISHLFPLEIDDFYQNSTDFEATNLSIVLFSLEQKLKNLQIPTMDDSVSICATDEKESTLVILGSLGERAIENPPLQIPDENATPKPESTATNKPSTILEISEHWGISQICFQHDQWASNISEKHKLCRPAQLFEVVIVTKMTFKNSGI